MRNAIIVLGLGSIFILSMGFLVLALIMNRQWTKEIKPRSPSDDD
jgi:biotin transporter BioY